MLRAASGQLGTASIVPDPPDTRIRPRLKAIASSSGSFTERVVPAAIRRLAELVTMSIGAGAMPGRSIETVRDALSHRTSIKVPNRASEPLAVAT